MQINKPPSSPPSSGVSTSGSGSSAMGKAGLAENPLARLVGQVINAVVVQSKAVQIATAQAALLQAGIAARLTTDERDQKTPTSTQTTSAATGAASSSTSASTSTSGTATTTSTSTSAATALTTTAAPATTTTATTPAPPTQTQYQTTLQIGDQRVVVMSEQPLQPGTQLTLKISSPQNVQLLQPAAAVATPPPAAPDLAGNLLNTMLRQALPLQQPVVKLLATIANDLLLNSKSPTTGTSGTTSNPLAASGINIPASLAPVALASLKPLLSQILSAQLTVDNVTEPDALRIAVTNSGLFREARLVQWAQALLKQYPDMPARGPAASTAQGASNLASAASLLQSAAQAATSAPGSALAQTAASILTPQTATTPNNPLSPNTATGNQTSTGLPPASTNTSFNATTGAVDALEAKQAEVVRNATATNGNASSTTLQNAIDAPADADIDTLRDELLKALSARAQKNQPAFATQTGTTAVSAETARTVASAGLVSHPGTGIPVNAKTATAALPIDTSVNADTKTTLEKLVSVTSQQLLKNNGQVADNSISEEHVLAILRQLPSMPEHAAAAKGKPQNDDDQWLLQLLRSSFGALKHLQLQQATNLNAAPTAQHAGADNPVAPVQIELPILVAQQWHSVNIEIDRRAPDNRSDSNRNERSWRVTLRFELPQQGIIVAQLNLAGVHVNATLWAEKQATCQQLQQQLKDLSDRLGGVGANVTTLDVRHGQPPSAKTRIEQRLIDVRT